VRHNEVIHPGERSGEATFVGLEHIEPNSGRRIGSQTIDLGNLTGRKPTFRKGHIVYGYLRPYLNKVWVAEFDGYSSVDQFAFAVRPELAETEYVAAFMRSETFLRRSSILTTTGQLPRIGTEQIAAVPIELPPVDVQRHIAADVVGQLAAADAASQACRQRLAAAELLGGAYLTSIFESAEARSWKPRRIGEVAPVQTGFAFKSDWFVQEGGIRVLRNANIHQGFIDWSDVVAVDADVSNRFDAFALESGDIVLTLDRPLVANGLKVARVDVGDTPSLLNQRVARFQVDTSAVDVDFLYAFLRSPAFSDSIRGHDQSLGVPHISPTQVERVELPLPSLMIQKRVVSALSLHLRDAATLVNSCREESAAIEALPQAYLREAFGGVSY
jgi:type I restriction enzyme S subunit